MLWRFLLRVGRPYLIICGVLAHLAGAGVVAFLLSRGDRHQLLTRAGEEIPDLARQGLQALIRAADGAAGSVAAAGPGLTETWQDHRLLIPAEPAESILPNPVKEEAAGCLARWDRLPDGEETADGRVLRVGRGRAHQKPSEVAALVRAGDEVQIRADIYRCDVDVTWKVNDLTLKGMCGRAHLSAAGCSLAGGKGIWIPTGHHLAIENMEFSGASVRDHNGAGLRLESTGQILIRNSFFHHNENGILATPNPKRALETDLTVEFSEFADNGYTDGRSHNIYVNRIRSFTLRGSYSHHAVIGHLVKSRADRNHILFNRLVDESGGLSSYTIDLPQGGESYIVGNLLGQSNEGPNRALLAYAGENGGNSAQTLYVVHNTIVNDRSAGGTGLLFWARTPESKAVLANNLVIGLKEADLVSVNPEAATLVNNLVADGSAVQGRGQGNYALAPASAAVDRARALDAVAPSFAVPIDRQYRHPLGIAPRPVRGTAPDLGGLEGTETVAAPALTFTAHQLTVSAEVPADLRWTSLNTETCQGLGSWSGSLPVSGRFVSRRLTGEKTFGLQCDGPGGMARGFITIELGP